MVKFNTKSIINPVDAIGELFTDFGISTSVITPDSETLDSRTSVTKVYVQQLSPSQYSLEMHFQKNALQQRLSFDKEISKMESVIEPGVSYTTKNYVFKGYKLYDLTFIKENINKIVFSVSLDAIIERK